MDKDLINKAINKKYSEVSDIVKAELHKKLTSHETSVAYAKEFDRIQDLKQKFADINGDTEE